MNRFAGQTVLVSGASRGLGREIATAFGREGAWVAIGYRDREAEAHEVLGEVRRAGGDGLGVALDVNSDESVAQALERVVAVRSSIEVLVNNAGTVQDELFASSTHEAWRDTFETNLFGAVRLSRAAARVMLRRRTGAIVNVGSVAGLRPRPGQSSYGASKAALLSLTRSMAVELAASGIRVNAVVPGLLDAGMVVRMDSKQRARGLEHVPLRRLGSAAEAANAVLFLASAEASYVVGQALVVDGGLTL